MRWQVATKYFILISVGLIIVYDLFALFYGGVEATISHEILNYSKEMPAIAFAAGFLCGHLFWGQDQQENKDK
jgi:hypothetical protein